MPAGTWAVRLHALEVRDGRYDAWIERDDPRPLGGWASARTGPSLRSSPSARWWTITVSSLGCGTRVSPSPTWTSQRQINVSSSQGPTRDGRDKPDVAAPGTDIVAAKGF